MFKVPESTLDLVQSLADDARKWPLSVYSKYETNISGDYLNPSGKTRPYLIMEDRDQIGQWFRFPSEPGWVNLTFSTVENDGAKPKGKGIVFPQRDYEEKIDHLFLLRKDENLFIFGGRAKRAMPGKSKEVWEKARYTKVLIIWPFNSYSGKAYAFITDYSEKFDTIKTNQGEERDREKYPFPLRAILTVDQFISYRSEDRGIDGYLGHLNEGLITKSIPQQVFLHRIKHGNDCPRDPYRGLPRRVAGVTRHLDGEGMFYFQLDIDGKMLPGHDSVAYSGENVELYLDWRMEFKFKPGTDHELEEPITLTYAFMGVSMKFQVLEITEAFSDKASYDTDLKLWALVPGMFEHLTRVGDQEEGKYRGGFRGLTMLNYQPLKLPEGLKIMKEQTLKYYKDVYSVRGSEDSSEVNIECSALPIAERYHFFFH